MPNPKRGEKQSDYIKRFMRSKEARRSYPDREQRSAVAYGKWKKRKR